MNTPNEIARDAWYETRDAGKPTCHVCHKTEREVSLVWCGAAHCDNSICTGCATPLQFKLEACSDEHVENIAEAMIDREAKLRSALYRARRERRAA
jgi:hypothetical protein